MIPSAVRKTDFPVIACAVVTGIVHGQETWYFSVGARPIESCADREEMGDPGGRFGRDDRRICERGGFGVTYGSNMRGERGIQAASDGSAAAS